MPKREYKVRICVRRQKQGRLRAGFDLVEAVYADGPSQALAETLKLAFVTARALDSEEQPGISQKRLDSLRGRARLAISQDCPGDPLVLTADEIVQIYDELTLARAKGCAEVPEDEDP